MDKLLVRSVSLDATVGQNPKQVSLLGLGHASRVLLAVRTLGRFTGWALIALGTRRLTILGSR
jgi:hypothetical protein